jgi:hypothetical protein
MLQERLRGQDGHLVGDDAFDTAEVVDVGVGVDDPGDRPLTTMPAIQAEGGRGGLPGHQWVDHDHAAVALDQRHVGQVEAPHLVDAFGHLVQALPGAELGLPPQARVGRWRGIVNKECEDVVVPHHPSVAVPDHARLQRADPPAIGVVEVGPILERAHSHLPHLPLLQAVHRARHHAARGGEPHPFGVIHRLGGHVHHDRAKNSSRTGASACGATSCV